MSPDEWTWERFGPPPLQPPEVRPRRRDDSAVQRERRSVLLDAMRAGPRCPVCDRWAQLTLRRRVMVHRAADGRECAGTGREVA